MSTSQVRDLPDDLHGNPKGHPAQRRRDAAQQAAVAAPEMPRAASEPLEPTASTSRSTRLEPPAERQERIGRRKAAFEQMSRMA